MGGFGQAAKVVTEAHLEVVPSADAELDHLRPPCAGSFPGKRLHECLLGADEFRRIRQTVPVDKPLCFDECLTVERGDAAREVVDERIKFGVRQRAVDPTIAFGGRCVEVVASKDDLERASATGEHWKAFYGSSARNKTCGYFGLAEHRSLQTRE